MKKPLVILTGPTAVGKTAASIALAKRIGGEIISADSIQVYKYMDIGSAKITPEEMDGVRHYLVDILDPSVEFNVAKFQQLAKEAMNEIYEGGHIPIVVGGTGFYIHALLYDTDFTQENVATGYRDELSRIANKEGALHLHQMLHAVDPKSAADIHPNNVKRVIRALEFHKQTGSRISEHNQREIEKPSPYNFAYFVLNDIRSNLYNRIDARVDKMIEEGLVEEVRTLQQKGYSGDLVSMQGLGYKEILSYLNGLISLEEAIYLIKRDSRRFAKRQITWFKREKDVEWIDKSSLNYNDEEVNNKIFRLLEERNIV